MDTKLVPTFQVFIDKEVQEFVFPTIFLDENENMEKLQKLLKKEIDSLNNELSQDEKTNHFSVLSSLNGLNETGCGGPGTEIMNFLNSDSINALCNLLELTPFVIGALKAIISNIQFRVGEIQKKDLYSVNLPVKALLIYALDDLENKKKKEVSGLVFSSEQYNENGDCFFIFRVKESEMKDLFFLYEFQNNYMNEPFVFY